MIDWIAVSVNLTDHPKAQALAIAISEPLAEAYLLRIWAWCARVAQDGTVRGQSADAIVECAARWHGQPGVLVSALLDAGWLERTSDGLAVHDWNDHAGALLKKAESERERKRIARAESKSNQGSGVRGLSAERPRTIQGQSADSPRLDETRRDEKREETDRPSDVPAPSAPAPTQLSLVNDAPTSKPKREPKPRRPSAAEALVARFEAKRLAALPGALPWDLKPPEVNRRFAPDNAVGQALASKGADAFVAAFDAYLRESYWRERGFPLDAFLSQRERFFGVVAAQTPRTDGFVPANPNIYQEQDEEGAREFERLERLEEERMRAKEAANG